jgi:hypothetical protein
LPQLHPQDIDDEKGGAPRYLVAYCSIMTLLLAFFIILQAFASTQEAGLFYKGQGSFIRAIETFGLGGVWDRLGGPAIPGQEAPAYKSEEGQEEPPTESPRDPEMEQARRAMAALEDLFAVARPREGSGWSVSLPTPFSWREPGAEFTEEEKAFCRTLARQLEPVLLARGFVVRVTTVVHGPDGAETAELMRTGLERAGRVREQILSSMREQLQEAAAPRVYSFARRADAEGVSPDETGAQLRVDLMLTKPYAERIDRKEAN